jgi:clorobiocin biosynthesis protein CloN5
MSNAQTYAEPIRSFVVEQLLEGHGSDLELDSPLLELGIVDSFSLVEIVVFCERQFGIRIPDSELTPANLESVSALAALLERLAPGGEAGAPAMHADRAV